MKKAICAVLSAILIFSFINAHAQPELSAKSAILMEAGSGKVIFEKNPHESLPPASVTKIMTMLLAMEAIERGDLKYTTMITASERAKSMGGSTIFLDTGEKMSVDDLLKGVAVASGNDACVALAEHISGSCEAFAALMNERAAKLGMKDTHFVNCNGLDDDSHYTSAYDIAIMSRELLKHKDILKYTNIWMDSLRDGKFQLANTNKLIRFYSGANGLKTGSTSKAGCCISATAKRDGMQLIAVILGAPTSKQRFADASSLLNYGFSNFAVNSYGEEGEDVDCVKVSGGKSNTVMGVVGRNACVLLEKNKAKNVKVHINLPESIDAPIKKGQQIGDIVITLDGETVTTSPICAKSDIGKKNAFNYMGDYVRKMFFVAI